MSTTARRRRVLPVTIALVLLAGLAVLLATGLRDAGRPTERFALLGQPAPPLHGPTLDGGRFHLDSLEGSVVLVNVWASWCGPCRNELPLIRDASRRWADDGVEVVTINTRDGPVAARALLEEVHATDLLTVRDSKGRLAVAWGATGVPETFVVDRSGVVRARRVGEVTREWLQSHLSRWADS